MGNQRQKPIDQLQGHRPKPQTITLVADAPAVIAPAMPRGLHPVAQRAWKAFWRSPVAQLVDLSADEEAVRRWAYCLSEREELEAEIREHPVVQGSRRMIANPLIGLLKERTREIEHFRQAFGLTPLARLRLGITYSEADAALDRMERRRRQGHEPVLIDLPSAEG